MDLKNVVYIFIYAISSYSFCSITESENGQVNISQKHSLIKKITENAVNFFDKHSIDESCSELSKNPKWINGEIFPFIFDEHGICYIHGPNKNLIWKNITPIKISNDISLIEAMIQTGEKGDYISYFWDNGFKTSYIKTTIKNGIKFIIGAGFFPESAKYKAQQTVSSAAQLFNFKGKDITFSIINNPKGMFSHGNIFAFAYDFEGMCVAYGNNFTFIGQNRINTQDANGKFIVKEFISIAQSPKGEGWVDYVSTGAKKRAYVKRVTDPKNNKNYVIGAGYYPNQNFDTAKDLAQKAVTYLKQVGARKAFSVFNNPKGPFILGGLAVFVIGLDGYCYAKGNDLEFVNHNIYNLRDDNGTMIIKNLIDQYTQNGHLSAITSYKYYGTNTLTYSEKVDISDGKFIVGVDYFPNSKSYSARSLIKEAAIELKNTKSLSKSFNLFNSKKSRFFSGDLSIFVYDTKGICLANGKNKDNIWDNYSTNPMTKSLIDNIKQKAFNGGGWISYKVNNNTRRSYVKMVKTHTPLGNKNLIIGTGYFL